MSGLGGAGDARPPATGAPALAAETDVPAGHLPPEDHHRDVTGGGWLRPALFGAMDGLVSNTSLIAGVAGGGAPGHAVMLAGFAGLVAGAFSMAAGEYTSVRAQAEATLAEVNLEKLELRRSPDVEEAELSQAYVQRGLEPGLAREVARQLSRTEADALRAHTQEELGVDIDRLPQPWTAAGSSLGAFASGALVPLLPYLAGARVLWIALLLGAVGLFAAGALVSRFTARGVLYSGTRQLLVGSAAAAVTFGIGHLVGAGVS